MRNADTFDIASFDRHPAFRLTRTFRRHRQRRALFHDAAGGPLDGTPLGFERGLDALGGFEHRDSFSLRVEERSVPREIAEHDAERVRTTLQIGSDRGVALTVGGPDAQELERVGGLLRGGRNDQFGRARLLRHVPRVALISGREEL